MSGSLRVAAGGLQLAVFLVLLWLASDREAHERWHAWGTAVSAGCHCGHGHEATKKPSNPTDSGDRGDCVIDVIAHGKAFSSATASPTLLAPLGLISRIPLSPSPLFSTAACILPYGCGPPPSATGVLYRT